jgi:hypothetical protein
MAEPIAAAPRAPTKNWLFTAATIVKRLSAIAATPIAKPSILSKKFMELNISRYQKTLMHHVNTGFSKNSVIFMPVKETVSAAITNWHKNLFLALILYLSS